MQGARKTSSLATTARIYLSNGGCRLGGSAEKLNLPLLFGNIPWKLVILDIEAEKEVPEVIILLVVSLTRNSTLVQNQMIFKKWGHLVFNRGQVNAVLEERRIHETTSFAAIGRRDATQN